MTARDLDRLEGVHPKLIETLNRLLNVMQVLERPMFVAFDGGRRTLQRQQELYAQGRTAPGKIVTNADGVIKKSNHQPHADGLGYAVDCAFVVPVGGDPYDDAHPWRLYGEAAKALGLKWGGDWTKPDRPHVEL